jgi:hypothetical protein
MKVTVINNRPVGGESVYCVDNTAVEPQAEHEMTGRTKAEVVFQMGVADGNTVMVLAEIEGDDRAPVICDMKDPGNPAGGAATMAGVGFDIETEAGAAANVAPAMYLGVFDDEDCTIPAVNATLDTATTGTIDEGAGTSLLKVTPSAAGIFACSVDDAEDETVYIKGWPVGTDYIVDSSDIDDVVFSAA